MSNDTRAVDRLPLAPDSDAALALRDLRAHEALVRANFAAREDFDAVAEASGGGAVANARRQFVVDLAAALGCPGETDAAALLRKARYLADEGERLRADNASLTALAHGIATECVVPRDLPPATILEHARELFHQRDLARGDAATAWARVAELERELRAAKGQPERPMTGAEFLDAMAPHAAAFAEADLDDVRGHDSSAAVAPREDGGER